MRPPYYNNDGEQYLGIGQSAAIYPAYWSAWNVRLPDGLVHGVFVEEKAPTAPYVTQAFCGIVLRALNYVADPFPCSTQDEVTCLACLAT